MKGFFDVYGKPEMKVSLTFPGEITETNGEVTGTKVTWTRDLTATDQEPMTAIAKDSGGASGADGGGGTDGETDGGTDEDGTDADESAGAADDSQAIVLAGAGAGALVVLLALAGDRKSTRLNSSH